MADEQLFTDCSGALSSLWLPCAASGKPLNPEPPTAAHLSCCAGTLTAGPGPPLYRRQDRRLLLAAGHCHAHCRWRPTSQGQGQAGRGAQQRRAPGAARHVTPGNQAGQVGPQAFLGKDCSFEQTRERVGKYLRQPFQPVFVCSACVLPLSGLTCHISVNWLVGTGESQLNARLPCHAGSALGRSAWMT